MNAQELDFPDGHFDAVLLNLVLTVVPDGELAFREAWRVLKADGQVVIFDKFLPEDSKLSISRKFIGQIIRWFGTDPNRRLTDMIDNVDGLLIDHDMPGLFGGQYRIICMTRQDTPA